MYANTLYKPKPAFYHDRQWAHITDWLAELAPFYDQAKRMLGVVRNPTMTPSMGSPSPHPSTRTSAPTSNLFVNGKGSNAMGLLSTLMTDGGGRLPRGVKWLARAARHPRQLVSLFAGINHWSERAVIGLTMQALDNSITVYPRRTRLGRIKLTSRQGHGAPNPAAAKIGGFPLNSVGEMVDIPMTAHFIGAPMGGWKDSGVGNRHGEHGIFKYTNAQTISVQRLMPIAPPGAMPPAVYARAMTAAMRALQRLPGRSSRLARVPHAPARSRLRRA